MKRLLPNTKSYYAAEQFILDLKIHKDIFLDKNDVEIETYPSWNFYKVSVFRWSKNTAGCGTKEYRDSLWKKQQEAIFDLFLLTQPPISSWRWESQYSYPVETTPSGGVPGQIFFVKKA